MDTQVKRILVIGSGMKKYDGEVTTIDMIPFKGTDVVCDITQDIFPLEDDYFDEIISCHVFEHLGWTAKEDGLIHCLEECWRVLKPTGELIFDVPRFPSDAAIAHPEHRRFFVPNSFAFFQVPKGGIDSHGYLKHHWHIGIDLDKTNENNIHGVMVPNKKGCKYGYVKIIRQDLV